MRKVNRQKLLLLRTLASDKQKNNRLFFNEVEVEDLPTDCRPQPIKENNKNKAGHCFCKVLKRSFVSISLQYYRKYSIKITI